MNEIIEKTVFEVEGRQFATRIEALAYSGELHRQMLLQELFYDVSDLNESECEIAAKALAANYARIRVIMEGGAL